MGSRARRWAGIAVVALVLGASAGYVLAPRVFAESHLGSVEFLEVQMDGQNLTLRPGDAAFAPLAREALSVLHGVEGPPRVLLSEGPEELAHESDRVAVHLRDGHAVGLPHYALSDPLREAHLLLEANRSELRGLVVLCTDEPVGCELGSVDGPSTLEELARALVRDPVN